MPDVLLKTSLSSLRVARRVSDDAVYYVEAVYWRGCPLPYERPGQPMLGRGDLSTYILSPPIVRPWEPGVYYRLPRVAWEAVGSREPLSLIPLDIEVEHSPFGDTDERVYTSHLSYGAHTVCGLFPTDTAEKWAALPPRSGVACTSSASGAPTGCVSAGWTPSPPVPCVSPTASRSCRAP